MLSEGQSKITRREALRDAGVAGLGLAAAGAGIESLLAQAASASTHGTLKDIKHVVILMQENRSFDHYFGTLSGVRGFDDKKNRSVFFQNFGNKTLHPFHDKSGCLADITHDWGPQHKSWNNGNMDHFLKAHLEADGSSVGVETMIYYDRSDLAFYYGLADAFTICDAYHCSVMGPTDPNRLYSMTGTIDPAGKHGGPLVETLVATRAATAGKFTWTTMPEQLSAHGVSWKVYNGTGGGILDNELTYFKPYQNKSGDLYKRGIAPVFPNDFMADLSGGSLPQVSWLLTGVAATEHPNYSTPKQGQVAVRQIVEMLVKSKVWPNTALFITWDENGGFFDHVTPPTPPKGTKDEFLTVAKLPSAAAGIRGPIGLGFRVPMLVVSPFSRGGLVCSKTFDHTSTLRFLETRFGVEVPNLSKWRRDTTGDLTEAFNFAAKPKNGAPSLPNVTPDSCSAWTPPTSGLYGRFPKQEKGTRKRPSGVV
jgi:phospholipase C